MNLYSMLCLLVALFTYYTNQESRFLYLFKIYLFLHPYYNYSIELGNKETKNCLVLS